MSDTHESSENYLKAILILSIDPELSWLIGTIDFDLGLGFFGGKKAGKLGRYQNNHFIKMSIGYEF